MNCCTHKTKKIILNLKRFLFFLYKQFSTRNGVRVNILKREIIFDTGETLSTLAVTLSWNMILKDIFTIIPIILTCFQGPNHNRSTLGVRWVKISPSVRPLDRKGSNMSMRVIFCFLFHLKYFLVDNRYSLLDDRYSLVNYRYSLLDNRYSLLDNKFFL